VNDEWEACPGTGRKACPQVWVLREDTGYGFPLHMPRLWSDILLFSQPAEVRPQEEGFYSDLRAFGEVIIYRTSNPSDAVKVYLSVPMIANRSVSRALLIARAIEDSGHSITSPWVLGPVEKVSPAELNIFERDTRGVEESDAIVADISEPSTGVGMEIMTAYKAGKRIIMVARRESVRSGMIRHMKHKELVEYDKEDEIYANLMRVLSSNAPSDR
jgi:2'-deoxynucleoside 5'-phosphate N-hydrolase